MFPECAKSSRLPPSCQMDSELPGVGPWPEYLSRVAPSSLGRDESGNLINCSLLHPCDGHVNKYRTDQDYGTGSCWGSPAQLCVRHCGAGCTAM